MLKYAIKHVDIGLLKRLIIYSYLYFNSSSTMNYAREILYFQRLITTNACNPVLYDAIIASRLVNNQGKVNSFFKVDCLIELLNLQLKDLLYSYRNSIFSIKELFKQSVLITSYIGSLRVEFKPSFSKQTNTTYSTKLLVVDIQSLTNIIIQEDLITYQQFRKISYKAPALLQ